MHDFLYTACSSDVAVALSSGLQDFLRLSLCLVCSAWPAARQAPATGLLTGAAMGAKALP